MEIKILKLATLTPYWRNPRQTDNAVEAVKQSIREFGFNSPLIIDKDHVIIAGHVRYRALMEMGVIDVPCVIADLTPEQAKAYRIADNKTSEMATWIPEALLAELRELPSIDAMSIYFPTIDVAAMLEDHIGPVIPVTQDEIDKASTEADMRFESKAQTVIVEVTCPHCDKDFSIDPGGILAARNKK